LILTATAVFSLSLLLMAASEPQSKEALEIKALVDKGAALVESKGKNAFPEFRKKGSVWYQGERYLFVDDFDGSVLVHLPDPDRKTKHRERERCWRQAHHSIVCGGVENLRICLGSNTCGPSRDRTNRRGN